MLIYIRRDPGPCPVCGAPHTICTAPGPASLIIPQLPARDAVEAPELRVGAVDAPSVDVQVDAPSPASPPARTFSTGTYRRPKGR